MHIIPQLSGDFDSEAHPELKTPPDPSKISIGRNFSKPCISIWTKIISRSYISKFLEMIRPQLLVRNDISLIRRKMLVFRMTEV